MSGEASDDGYTVNPRSRLRELKVKPQDKAPTFQNRSVNPHTGSYVVYHIEKPNLAERKYGGLPARHSYLGI